MSESVNLSSVLSGQDRQAGYGVLSGQRISENVLEELREATNKAWGLGNDRFRARIEERLNCQVTLKKRGGDRKSKDYCESRNINRV